MPSSQIPHDAAYKSFFSDKDMVTSLFQDFVPEDFVLDIDFTTLELIPTNHVTKERTRFRSRRQAKAAISEYIEIFYNSQGYKLDLGINRQRPLPKTSGGARRHLPLDGVYF